jgi:hypothetical protein
VERASEEELVLVPLVFSPRKRLRRFRMRGFVRDVGRKDREGYLVGTDLVCELAHLEYPDPPIDERGLRPCQAPEPPHNVDRAVHEKFLDRSHRRELCTNLVQEVFEGICVLSREDDVTGKKPVPERVEADDGFPSCVFGPVEWRAFARLAAFCRSLVMVPAF